MAEVSARLAAQLAEQPLKLAPNRVWRVYRGGYLLDQLRGELCRPTPTSPRTGPRPTRKR